MNETGVVCILKTGRGKYHVNYQAIGNMEILSHTESLTSMTNCKKNIRAMARLFKGKIPTVYDQTGAMGKVIKIKP